MQCPECSSEKLHKKGIAKTLRTDTEKQRYKCMDCGFNFYIELGYSTEITIDKTININSRTPNVWVITSAVSNTDLNYKLLRTLENYTQSRNAELLIIPIKYRLNQGDDYTWDEILDPYLTTSNIKLATNLKLLGNIPVSPSIGNPLSGMEPFSKGDSVIFAHPQIMMKTVAVNHTSKPAVIHTTGAITNTEYTTTKQGAKAEFNHSFAALVVEEDITIDGFHIRVLNSSEDGTFYDLDKFYDGDKITQEHQISAIVLGDEHVMNIDENVIKATFTNEDSIVNVLKPKYIVRHDVLDFYSGSHHHKNNFFIQYAKFTSNKNKVEDELNLTYLHLAETTPDNAESIIISSNHNDHLLRWLNEVNIKIEIWNAELYHKLMYLMLKETRMGESGAEYPNPFQLWVEYMHQPKNIKFIGGYESFKIHDIELAFHGHQGTNGSRASAPQFSRLGPKTIIGHSHSPQIFGSCYQVGHSCKSKLEYNAGPSSWLQAHCIIQPNGKRQMIFIINGRWRA